jgi:hypothetical protein
MRVKELMFCGLCMTFGVREAFCAAPVPLAIKSPIVAGASIISGVTQPVADGTVVQIYVCIVKTKPAPAKDCSTGSPAASSGSLAVLSASALPPGAGFVVPDAAGNFSAPLATQLTAGEYVYVTQLATPAGAAAVPVATESAVTPVSSPPVISSALAAGALTVSGKAQASTTDYADNGIQVYVCSSATKPIGQPNCSAADNASTVVPTNSAAVGDRFVLTDGSGAFSATIPALSSGNYVWVTQVATPSAAAAAAGAVAQTTSTTPMTVSEAAAPGSINTAKFDAKAFDGRNKVTINATANDSISIWEFDAGSGINGSCSSDLSVKGVQLQIVTLPVSGNGGASAPTTTSTITKVATTGDTDLTLSLPLAAGQTLCLVDTPGTAGSQASWVLTPLIVSNQTDFGRVRVYFTLGAQATNQESSSNSSSAGQYLEAGFNSSIGRATDKNDTFCGSSHNQPCKHSRLGYSTNVDIRLSPIPVAATATTTTVTSAATTISSIAPNQLSSQQSVRAVGSMYFPWKEKGWNNNTDYFTAAPLAEAGFGTLINPTSSTSASANSGSAAPTQATTTTFAPGFYFWEMGARFGWDRFTSDRNEAPQMITQVVVTLGDFSNLPSYVCKPVTGQPSNPYTPAMGQPTVVTACSQYPSSSVTIAATSTAPSSTTYNYYAYDRTLRPRLNVEAIAKLPGYPFILGVDANLQQYGIFTKPNIDYLNKPGNDVRIYIGISVDLATLMSKL